MKVAIFDFDGTLFPVETIPFLMKQYTKMGHSRYKQVTMMMRLLPDLVAYKLKIQPDKEIFRHKAVYKFLSLFEGMTEEEVHEFFLANVSVVRSLLDPEIVEEVKKRKQGGFYTVLLSGCFDMLLKPLGEAVGFDEVIGTSLVFMKHKDDRHRMKSSTPITIVSGDNKLAAAEGLGGSEVVDWEASAGYADSSYDAPMLKLVGHSIAVNPDQALEAMAKELGWAIMVTQKGLEKVKYS